MSSTNLQDFDDDNIKDRDEIELAQPAQSFIYWVDSELSPMWTIFCLFVVFLCVEIWMTLSAPHSFISKHEVVKVDSPQPPDPYTLDVSLEITKIQQANRFIEINATVLRKNTDAAFDLKLNLESRYVYEHRKQYQTKESARANADIHFDANSDTSNSFVFFKKTIDKKFDTILIETQVASEKVEDIAQIVGFDFTWFFGNSASIKYRQYSGVFLSISLLIIFIGYVYSIRIEKNYIMEVLCLIFGIAGIFTLNPLSFFVTKVSVNTISSAILLSVFIATFRIFIAADYYYSSISPSIPNSYLLFITLFYCVGALISSCAFYDRDSYLVQGSNLSQSIFFSEYVLALYNVVNLIFSCFMVFYILKKTKRQSRQTIMISVITFLTQAATFVTQVLFVVLKSHYVTTVVPALIFQIVHVTCAGICLHFMQPYEGIEYGHMDEVNNAKGDEAIEIDVQEPNERFETEDPDPATTTA
jgi:hypothetical protein